MSLFKKDEKVDKWQDDIDHQREKLTTYADDEDYNKGLELLIKMKENQSEDLKEDNKITTQDKIQDGIQIAGLGVSILGIAAGLFLGIGSYKADDSMETCHGKTWNIGQKLMDKATNKKK